MEEGKRRLQVHLVLQKIGSQGIVAEHVQVAWNRKSMGESHRTGNQASLLAVVVIVLARRSRQRLNDEGRVDFDVVLVVDQMKVRLKLLSFSGLVDCLNTIEVEETSSQPWWTQAEGAEEMCSLAVVEEGMHSHRRR